MGDFTSSSQLNSTLGDASVVDGQSVATFLYARLHNFSALCDLPAELHHRFGEQAPDFVDEGGRFVGL